MAGPRSLPRRSKPISARKCSQRICPHVSADATGDDLAGGICRFWGTHTAGCRPAFQSYPGMAPRANWGNGPDMHIPQARAVVSNICSLSTVGFSYGCFCLGGRSRRFSLIGSHLSFAANCDDESSSTGLILRHGAARELGKWAGCAHPASESGCVKHVLADHFGLLVWLLPLGRQIHSLISHRF